MTSKCEATPMIEPQIRFDDGADYERMMGEWSRLAGEVFLDWLAPPSGLRWPHIVSDRPALTALLVDPCGAGEVQGLEPSEGQRAFARERLATRNTEFRLGNAMALPFPAHRF